MDFKRVWYFKYYTYFILTKIRLAFYNLERFMKKTFIATSLLTLLASVAFAQDYSYDANGVYTDTRGFTVFDGLTLDNVKYSGIEKTSYANSSNNGFPVYSKDSYVSSSLGIYNSSITNSNFSNSKYSVTSEVKDTSSLYLSKDSSLKDVDFSNSSFIIESVYPKNGSTLSSVIRLDGDVENVNFSNSTFKIGSGGSPAIVSINGNVNGLDFSNSNFIGSTAGVEIYSFAISFNGNIKNLNINNAKFNAYTNAIIAEYNGTIEGLSAHNVSFNGMSDSYAIYVDEIKSADFRGATVNAYGTAETQLLSNANILSLEGVKNVIMGNGEIHSYSAEDASDWELSKNLGLVLAEGETFKISKYEPKDGATTFALANSGISAKLTANSEIKGGTIIFDEGETLNIEQGITLSVSGNSVIDNGVINFAKGSSIVLEDGSTLTLSETEFILADGVDATSILTAGENSTIVMAGYSNEEAESAFASMFKDSNGDTIKDLGTSFENFNIVGGAAVPEPSTYAAIFGALALGFAIYRRRK